MRNTSDESSVGLVAEKIPKMGNGDGWATMWLFLMPLEL